MLKITWSFNYTHTNIARNKSTNKIPGKELQAGGFFLNDEESALFIKALEAQLYSDVTNIKRKFIENIDVFLETMSLNVVE